MRLTGLHKALLISVTVHGVVGAAVLAHVVPGRSPAIGQPLVAVLEAGGPVTSAPIESAGGDGPARRQRPRHLIREADALSPARQPPTADTTRKRVGPEADASAEHESLTAEALAARTWTAARGVPTGRQRRSAAKVPALRRETTAAQVQQDESVEVPQSIEPASPASREPQPAAEHSAKDPDAARADRAADASRAAVASRAVTAASSRSARPLAGNPTPEYPWPARRRGIEGEVVLSVRVLPSGTAAEVRVKASSGYRLLDQAALESVRRWRFAPALRAGQAVPEVLHVPVRFELRTGRG